MANRNGGFIGTDGLDAPDPPTAVTPTAGSEQVSVAFTAPTDAGTSAITGFVVQVSTNDTDYSAGSNTGTSSPIVVSSLTNDTAATAKVWAINAYGTSAPSSASASFTPTLPSRALVFGGTAQAGGDAPVNQVDLFDFSSLGNGTDFGDLSVERKGAGGTGSTTRTLVAGGESQNADGYELASIDYFSIASAGNASDFGDLTDDRYFLAATGSSTRSVFIGGEDSGNKVNVMDYVTIASLGNATDFGDVAVRCTQGQGCGSTTRGLHGGGKNLNNSTSDVVEYITIANTGNSTDFGNLSSARRYVAACSNSTRALFAGGDGSGGDENTIDYFTIASLGNATDFGNLIAVKNGLAGTASSTIGCFFGGVSAYTNDCQKVTIGSTGNAAYFGELVGNARGYLGAASNVHGGIS